jgi:hypothetical protein
MRLGPSIIKITMNKSKLATIIFSLLGVVFLVFPLLIDSYSHNLQDSTYNSDHSRVIECRANIALKQMDTKTFGNAHILERFLDQSCGVLPKYNDFAYESENGIIGAYNWFAQKITFIPL